MAMRRKFTSKSMRRAFSASAGNCQFKPDNSFDSGSESGYTHLAVKKRRHSSVKQMEAQARSVVKASRGTSKAAAQQRRVSMAGGVKWEITNWRQVAGAFAKWA